MKITVRYFASIREAIGHGSESVDTTAATLGALRDDLIARGGAHASSLARGRAVRMALNQNLSDEAAARPRARLLAWVPPRAMSSSRSAPRVAAVVSTDSLPWPMASRMEAK